MCVFVQCTFVHARTQFYDLIFRIVLWHWLRLWLWCCVRSFFPIFYCLRKRVYVFLIHGIKHIKRFGVNARFFFYAEDETVIFLRLHIKSIRVWNPAVCMYGLAREISNGISNNKQRQHSSQSIRKIVYSSCVLMCLLTFLLFMPYQ